MTAMTLNQNYRLTDALERDLLRGAMERQQNVHPAAMLKSAGTAIISAVRGLADYIAEVNAAMNRARIASTHYTGSQW